MALLGHERYCDEVVAQVGMLTDLLVGADMAVKVPTCPEWTLDDLVRHVGTNLRVIETAVRTETPVVDHHEPGPGRPATWLADTAAEFADTLRKAGPDAVARVWGLAARTDYLARRATHDLVVHRADVAITVGADYAVSPEVAVDAIDELLEMIGDPGVVSANPRMAELRGSGTTIHLHGTDDTPDLAPEWLIEFHSKGFTWRRGHAKATVAARGTVRDLLLVFYRRLPPTDRRIEVLGDASLLDFWLDRVSLE
ncbi:maleylpyruvate isomerase family mycothiol-dependent enzyme [Sinosporangium siamense]|nr:maleylpyruvate isomerase family mycothiol-dependent enzyme [Sinosporangium siamense]